MNITSINSNYNSRSHKPNLNPSFGNKHIVNRYLYHVTDKHNYERILQSGVIRTSLDSCGKRLNGVFMFSLENFLRRWGKLFDKSDLRYILFDDKIFDDIVLLRIPVKKLDIELLRYRSQEKFMRARYAKNFNRLDKNAHEIIGEPANTMKAKISRKHEPIEYIYTSPIPADIVEFAGEANFANIKSIGRNLYYRKGISKMREQIVKITLNTVFENQPELNAVKHIMAIEKS